MKAPRRVSGTTLIRAVLLLLGMVGGVIGPIDLVPAVPHLADKVTFLAWFLTPAVLSDALLMPAAAVIGLAAGRLLPHWLRAPVVAGAVLSAALFAVALPFLGRPGLRPDNPSLLNRNYPLGFVAVVAVIWAGVLGWALLRRRGGDRPAERSRLLGAAVPESPSGPSR